MTTTKVEPTVNGVEVAQLKQIVKDVRDEPSLGRSRFRVSNRWRGGSRNRSRIAGFFGAGQENDHPEPFTLDCDEPPVLLGDDQAPNPVEYLLHALAGCVTTSLAYHAAARGIRIAAIESTVEGDLDMRGFLGLTDEVPRGFQNIRVTFRVESDAPPDKLTELAKFSPVLNTVAAATPIHVAIEKAG